MSLTCVKMSEDVWLTCLTHALSTETEEIMGLLLGDIEHSKNGSVTALIWGASPQTRSDRRKDRVETHPEQLAAASVLAERMTALTGRTTRVIGWYHSHPHITVLPSHVDVRTQGTYQLLDSGFIGLIFSCFSEDANKVGRIQVIAFQSSDGKQNHTSRPISLSPVYKSSVIDVESSLSSSNNVPKGSSFAKVESPELDTGDSTMTGAMKTGGQSSELGVFFSNRDANYQGKERMGGNYLTGNADITVADLDPMDLSESLQEAVHRSNLDMRPKQVEVDKHFIYSKFMSGIICTPYVLTMDKIADILVKGYPPIMANRTRNAAEFTRKEIPLHVFPTASLINFDSPLMSFTDLQRVLYEEERTAYNQAILLNVREGKMHPLSYMHHSSTYQASMCKLIEYCISPAIKALHDRLKENEIRLSLLAEETVNLETESSRANEPSSPSARQASAIGSRGSGSASHRDLYSPTSSAEMISPRVAGSPKNRSRKGPSQ